MTGEKDPDNSVDEALERAIDAGHLEDVDREIPGVEELFEVYQKLDSWIGLFQNPLDAGAEISEQEMPSEIGHYQLREKLGSGSFGTVYLAYDRKLDRQVAIKIPRYLLPGDHGKKQFLREARAAAALKHPHIVSVHEVGEEKDLVYIVSDFIEGESLDQWHKGEPLDPRKAASLCVTIAEAMDHAHQAGIVHRDIKPSNIMMDNNGNPHVMDFGLAKRELTDASLSIEGRIVGTPAYMSPEQARGDSHQVDSRTDVYGLGMILFELLTGERPFRGSSQMLLHQVLHEDAPSLRKLNHSIPRDLETIALKCLEKEPGKRYSTAVLFSRDLDNWLENRPISARSVGRLGRAIRWCKRRPAVAGLSAAVALLLLTLSVGGVIVALQQARLRKEAQASEKLVRKSVEELRRQGYLTDMLLAQRHWEAGDIGNLRQLIDRHSNDNDLKGFEWDYWNNLLNSELLTISNETIVEIVAFSPDGKRIASNNWGKDGSGSVKVWDAETGQLAVNLQGHKRNVSSLAFSRDGKQIISGSLDTTVKVWDAETGEELLTFQGHSGNVMSVTFSPDGKQVISGGYDKTVKIWDTETGQVSLTFQGHSGNVMSVAISPDGKQVVSGGSDKAVKVWDVETGKEILMLAGHSEPVSDVSFSPDGKWIASGSADNTMKVWDVETGEELLTLRDSQIVSCLSFSPDGKRIVSCGGSDNTVKTWDSTTGQKLDVFKGHSSNVRSVAFSPDGKRIVSGSSDTTVKVWDAETGQESLTLDGDTDYFWQVAFLPDGKRIIGGASSKLTVWNAETGEELRTLDCPGRIVAFSPNGEQVALVVESTVMVWDAETGEELLTFQGHSGNVVSVAFSPDGKRLASGSHDKTVKVWDTETGEELLTYRGHSSPLLRVEYSPDGKRIASSTWPFLEGTEFRIWDSQSGEETMLRTDPSKPAILKFSPNGNRIIGGGADNTMKVWDVETGKDLLTLKGHPSSLFRVEYSPDGKRIVGGDADGRLKVWDAETGQETLTLNGHTNQLVLGLDFSPDGKRIVSSGNDGTVKIWDARPLKTGKAK